MSIFSRSNTPDGKAIQGRKKDHFEICTNPSQYNIESSRKAGFEAIRFVHESLPELAWDEIDLSTQFLGETIAFPFFISCMTGGFAGGERLNGLFASAANRCRVPFGLGSIRVLFKHPEYFNDFYVKPQAQDIPVLANLGAVQVRELAHDTIIEMIKKLEVQALVIHLNPGQEIAQPGGDRDFRGLCDAIQRLIAKSPLPIIVKETGFGIRPSRVRELLEMGAAYVDLAGAGGTNWLSVDAARLPVEEAEFAISFSDWGIPTAVLLDAIGYNDGHIIASGGIRSGVDIAKSVALGASISGIALSLARDAAAGGEEAVVRRINIYEKEFRSVMLLTGSADIAALRSTSLLRDPNFMDEVAALQSVEK